MTPQQKAKQLIDKFTVVGLQQRNEGIQCALIAVDEVISVIDPETQIKTWLYWKAVKHHIHFL